MEKLFQQDNLHEIIDRDGVTQQPFLNAEELTALRNFYFDLHPDGVAPQMRDGIHMTIWCADRAYKDRVREGIERIIRPACERMFSNFRLVSPVFIVKQTGDETTFPIHQDWNVVDESRHRAFNLWIPLFEVDETNGALWFVKGSHRLPTHIRGAGILFPQLRNVRELLRPRMELAAMEPGEAVIFYHRVIHGSPPNKTNNPRVVVAVSVLPKEVPLHIYFQESPESNLKVFNPPDDFIYEYANVRDDTGSVPPVGNPIAELPPYQLEQVSEQLLIETLDGKKKPGFFQKIGQALGLSSN